MRKRGAKFSRAVHNPLARIAALQTMGQRIPTNDLDRLELARRIAFERVRLGHAGEVEYHTLACVLNISQVLCERGFGTPDETSSVRVAQQALFRAGQRDIRHLVFDGSGLSALRTALGVHDAQCSACSRGDLLSAFKEVSQRVDRGETLKPAEGDSANLEGAA